MKIRLAREEDIPQILEMKGTDQEDRFKRRLEQAEIGRAVYLVAEDGGEIVGNVLLKFYGKRTAPYYPDIEDLYVREDLRSSGIGSKLVKKVEKFAREKGFRKIGLSVDPNRNERAKELYTRLGFKPVKMDPYLNGVYNGREEWVIDMVKELI